MTALEKTSGTPPAISLKSEEEKLRELMVRVPDTILAVSDLHLGPGQDSDTGRYVRSENFFADQKFGRFLNYLEQRQDGLTLLVLNGDTFDFIRVCNCPSAAAELTDWSTLLGLLGMVRTPEELRRSISSKERTYGLQTDDYKSTWKLLQIFLGHRSFFSGLAGWVNAGGLVLFIKGNHDLDLYWPLVRRALRHFIAQSGTSSHLVEERVLYCDDAVQIANVYLEHGYRYDPQQQIVGGPTLPGNPSQLNLPLASFVARYLLNPLEEIEPFVDDIRPTEKIPWLLLRRHPLQSLRVLFHSLRFIQRAAEMSQLLNSFWFFVYFASLLIPILTTAAIVLTVLPSFRSWVARVLAGHQVLYSAIGLLTPYLAAGLKELWDALKLGRPRAAGEDEYGEGLYCTLSGKPTPAARVLYAVMGHTHEQNIQKLPPLKGTQVFYLNTGTWIPLWPEDRPDLIGQILYPFVRFTHVEGEYLHEYLEWRDDRGAPAESMILKPRGALN